MVWLLSGGGWPTVTAWPRILGSRLRWFGLYMITLNWANVTSTLATAAMLVKIGAILLVAWRLAAARGVPRRLAAAIAVSFGRCRT